MSPEHNNTVWIAFFGISNDIPRLTILKERVNEEVHSDSLASCNSGSPGLGDIKSNHTNRHKKTDIFGAQSTSIGSSIRIVRENDPQSAAFFCQFDLVRDAADATFDKGNFSSYIKSDPLILEAPGTLVTYIRVEHVNNGNVIVMLTSAVIDRNSGELRCDAVRYWGRMIVDKSVHFDILMIGSCQCDLARLLVGMIEELLPDVKVVISAVGTDLVN